MQNQWRSNPRRSVRRGFRIMSEQQEYHFFHLLILTIVLLCAYRNILWTQFASSVWVYMLAFVVACLFTTLICISAGKRWLLLLGQRDRIGAWPLLYVCLGIGSLVVIALYTIVMFGIPW